MAEMTKEEKFKALAAPFPASDIEYRIGSSSDSGSSQPWARLLAYLTARAIQSRLDEVLGPDNWKNEYKVLSIGDKVNGVLCGLSVRFHYDGEWITKWDGAECTDVEPFKGALSDATKRAAVQLGLGRYLYDLGETWATDIEEGKAKVKGSKRFYAKFKDGRYYSYNAPPLPQWARIKGDSSDVTAGSIPPPPADTPEPPKPTEPPAKTSNKAKVNAAKAKIALTGTVEELGVISKYAESLLEKGDITEADRKEIDKAVKDATKRIKSVAESPHNPESKE